VSLTPSQLEALRELQQILGSARMVMIGATALGFYGGRPWRHTADVDLVVALELEDFPGPLLNSPGWTSHPTKPHEFNAPSGSKIDLIPAGQSLLQAGRLVWQRGDTMSLHCMDLAFTHAESHTVGDVVVLVAPPPVVAVLKMVSFSDRPAARERDLEDIGHLLDAYVDGDSLLDRWDEAFDCGEFDLAPAYLLGLDMARIVASGTHKDTIQTFLERVGPEGAHHATMVRVGPARWRTETRALERRLQAFRQGLSAR
jgi:predicted nucleotidyltransferase